MAEQSHPNETTPTVARRRTGLITVIAVTSALVGGAATTALGQGAGPYSWWGGGPGFGWMGPASIDQRIERGIKHLAIEIDASKDQQDRLITITASAVKDLLSMREKSLAGRKQAIDLLTQPVIDRVAVEKLRAEQMATADEASRRIAKALADVAEVLTPEQRRTIADRIPPPGAWRPWHGGWHRG